MKNTLVIVHVSVVKVNKYYKGVSLPPLECLFERRTIFWAYSCRLLTVPPTSVGPLSVWLWFVFGWNGIRSDRRCHTTVANSVLPFVPTAKLKMVDNISIIVLII